MTDPGIADATYIEPLTPEFQRRSSGKRNRTYLDKIGGQTALNLAMKLHEQGILQRYTAGSAALGIPLNGGSTVTRLIFAGLIKPIPPASRRNGMPGKSKK